MLDTAETARGPISALICGGGSSLGQAVALELAGAGVAIGLSETNPSPGRLEEVVSDIRGLGGDVRIVTDPGGDPGSVIAAAVARLGRLDILVNLMIPDPVDGPGPLASYPGDLLARGLAAAGVMPNFTPHAAIVNFCFLPSAYVGTSLEDHLPALKGALTGVTRTLCRRFGRDGVRVNCVQTGLIDLPEVRAFAGEVVRGIKVPVGRWGSARDVAKLIAYLALENRYMTGQVVIVDGGLTAGLTGT